MSDPSIASRLDEIVDKAAERIASMRERLDEALADHPFGGRKMNPDEQMERFLLGRNDPAFWQEMILKRQMRHGLAPDVLPKEVADYDREMQKRYERRMSGAVGSDGDL